MMRNRYFDFDEAVSERFCGDYRMVEDETVALNSLFLVKVFQYDLFSLSFYLSNHRLRFILFSVFYFVFSIYHVFLFFRLESRAPSALCVWQQHLGHLWGRTGCLKSVWCLRLVLLRYQSSLRVYLSNIIPTSTWIRDQIIYPAYQQCDIRKKHCEEFAEPMCAELYHSRSGWMTASFSARLNTGTSSVSSMLDVPEC